METRDGWHVPAGEGSAEDKTIINRIMLRFRPIAPKPAAVGSSSGEISPDGKSSHFSSKRVKRKYIRVAKNNKNNYAVKISDKQSNNRSSPEDKSRAGLDSAVVTLQLMPEKTDSQEFPGTGRSWCNIIDPTVGRIPDNRELPTWMSLKPKLNSSVGPDLTAAVTPPVLAVESWVTVESVTDTCMDVRVLGCTDVEKLKSLEKDTCPGFISDGSNKVRWVNEAYKRMVSHQRQQYDDGQYDSPEPIVWLVARGNLPYNCPAFSCRVRLQYTWQKEKCSKMVPCDVWRMECGLAWRLDIKAALSLGL